MSTKTDMEQSSPALEDEELKEEITFDISTDQVVTAKVKYRKGDIVDQLIQEVTRLKQKVNILEEAHQGTPVDRAAIQRVWDNPEDEIWNEY